MNETTDDERTPGQALRRRRRLLAAAAVVGLASGGAYLTQVPPRMASAALVLLPPEGEARGAMGSVETQAEIVLSATVLGPAGAAVSPSVPARDLEKRVDVSAPTNQLLEIRAYDADGARAQALAQSVAESYVRYVKDSAAVLVSATLSALTARQEALSAQVDALDAQIATTEQRLAGQPVASAGAVSDARLLAQLRTSQAEVALRLDQLSETISTLAPPGTDPATGTSVVQPAAQATGRPLIWQVLLWPVTGALLFTLLATAMVLARSRGDRVLRLRDEIADAAGSRVLASLQAHPHRTVAGWSRLLDGYQAPPAEAWAIRRALRTLAGQTRTGSANGRGTRRPAVREHPASITVISLSGDAKGLAIGPQLAASAASAGLTTRIVTGPGHPSGAALWNACSIVSDEVRPNLSLGNSQPRDRVDLTVHLAQVDRGDPEVGALPRSAVTVLAVGAARVSQDDLARLTIALHDAGRRVDGVFVADPDRADRSTGRLNGDERDRQVVLPLRVTGGTR